MLYFIKLHMIAGQLNAEDFNTTDLIYTLTGKSGEVSAGEAVRFCQNGHRLPNICLGTDDQDHDQEQKIKEAIVYQCHCQVIIVMGSVLK